MCFKYCTMDEQYVKQQANTDMGVLATPPMICNPKL